MENGREEQDNRGFSVMFLVFLVEEDEWVNNGAPGGRGLVR